MVVLTIGVTAAAANPNTGGRPFMTTLTGAAEVPGPGDPDGSGTAALRLNVGQGTVCFRVVVEDIQTATAAHIHEADAGTAGPVVVGLGAPDANGNFIGCVNADRELIREILMDPSGYYVNVHNAEYPSGALRGQLSR